MSQMFDGCKQFNSDLNWDVSAVMWMDRMFYGCIAFNGNIEGWKFGSHVLQMHQIFVDCHSFNRDLSGWNMSNVKTSAMFKRCYSFNNRSARGWTVESNWFQGCVSLQPHNVPRGTELPKDGQTKFIPVLDEIIEVGYCPPGVNRILPGGGGIYNQMMDEIMQLMEK
jgi:hypothetical protein